jgi:hypothetical protein
MLSLGIQPSDALVLMEYEEIGYFIKLADKQAKKKSIQNTLDMNSAHTMAIIGTSSKKGSAELSKWRDKLSAKLSDEEVQQETLFTILKRKFKKPSSQDNLRKLRGL